MSDRNLKGRFQILEAYPIDTKQALSRDIPTSGAQCFLFETLTPSISNASKSMESGHSSQNLQEGPFTQLSHLFTVVL